MSVRIIVRKSVTMIARMSVRIIIRKSVTMIVRISIRECQDECQNN